MNRFGLLIRIEAKFGKEAEVERRLTSALALVEKESGTAAWYALRFGPTSFGIFDTFQDREGQDLHLAGRVAAALTENAAELYLTPLTIEKAEILAEKVSLTEAEIDGPPMGEAA